VKVSDLVRIKSDIKLDNGEKVKAGSVGMITDIVRNTKIILYKVHIPGITYVKVKGYYFSRQHIELVQKSNPCRLA
jgi:hypothetical protein